MAENKPPVDIKALRAQLRDARGVARGTAAAVGRFHTTDEGREAPAVSVPEKQAHDASVPQKPAASVSPFGPTEYVAGPAKGPPPAAKSAAAAGLSGAEANPVQVDLRSDIGAKIFGMRVTDLWGVISANKAEIRRRLPKLQKTRVTLMFRQGVYSVVKYDPPELKDILADRFNRVLEEMAKDTRKSNGTYTCPFDYMLHNALSLELPAEQPGANPRATVQILGQDGEAFAANAPPEIRHMCNYHRMPGPAGYAFVLYDRNDPKRKQKVYEVKLADKDDFHYLFAVSKVVDGRKSEMASIRLDMTSEDERFGFPEEGIEISFSTFVGGEKAIRMDPLDMARKAEPSAPHSRKEIAFLGALGLGTAAGYVALPEIIGFLNRFVSLDPVPESVTIGQYTIPARQVLEVSALALLGAVEGVIRLCSRKNTNKGDSK
jgi:hypothetical protein